MDLEQAIGILIGATEVGQSKGAYTLRDAALVVSAIDSINASNIINKPEDKPMESTTETPEVDTPAETGLAQTDENSSAESTPE